MTADPGGDRSRFETAAGDPVPAVTAGEMREIDRVAVEEVGLGLLQMMENVGRSLAGNARALADGPVTVLAGGGRNGGGLCCARHLVNHGREVRVVLDRDPGELDGAAATQWNLVDEMGVELEDDPERALARADLAVDATSGGTPGVAVDPDRTLTLALPKSGLGSVGGDLFLADIAIPATVYERVGIEYRQPFGGGYWIELA